MKFIKNKKAFTLIELIVVIAVIGILVLLGIPRFIGQTQKAELARIQHDVMVMEQEIGTEFINGDDDFNSWGDNNKDFNQLIQEGKLFEKEGVVKKGEPIDGSYKVIPEKYKDKINTKLKGTFYANSNGKVYYEHLKPLSGIPAEPEKEPLLEGPIPIATAEELDSIRKTEKRTYGAGTQWEGLYEGGLDKQYIQVADIDLSEYSKEEEGWNPIGADEESIFTGTYDGGNYVIRGLEVKGEGKDYQGLFGYAEGATISNVGLIDNKVTGGEYVGGLVGYSDSGSTISNSYATGSVEGSWFVGGLVGQADSGSTISNSYATGSVTGGGSLWISEYVGGLVGWANYDTTINNSYATGSVTGTGNYVGGLVGWANFRTEISNSYATGSVKVTGNYSLGWGAGGLVGGASGVNIENSYATGSVTSSGNNVGGLVGYAYDSTISNSYSTGSVEGTDTVGGLVGFTTNDTMINSSYWDKQTTKLTSSSGGEGKSTVEMMKQTTYSGWDFVNVWKIDEGNDYPKLR